MNFRVVLFATGSRVFNGKRPAMEVLDRVQFERERWSSASPSNASSPVQAGVPASREESTPASSGRFSAT